MTFGDEGVDIEVGGRQLELRWLGRGHTDNDIAVRVPDAAVLFAGDLLENGATPYFGDGYPLEWPATATALRELVRGAVVPGHGDVAGLEFVDRSIEAFRAIATWPDGSTPASSTSRPRSPRRPTRWRTRPNRWSAGWPSSGVSSAEGPVALTLPPGSKGSLMTVSAVDRQTRVMTALPVAPRAAPRSPAPSPSSSSSWPPADPARPRSPRRARRARRSAPRRELQREPCRGVGSDVSGSRFHLRDDGRLHRSCHADHRPDRGPLLQGGLARAVDPRRRERPGYPPHPRGDRRRNRLRTDRRRRGRDLAGRRERRLRQHGIRLPRPRPDRRQRPVHRGDGRPRGVPGRTPHIHLKLTPPGGSTLTTQVYFPDSNLNAEDGIFRPELLLAVTANGDARVGTYTFVLGG